MASKVLLDVGYSGSGWHMVGWLNEQECCMVGRAGEGGAKVDTPYILSRRNARLFGYRHRERVFVRSRRFRHPRCLVGR